jgi:hypothetical protein
MWTPKPNRINSSIVIATNGGSKIISTILAIWGSILSTGLAGIKILEIWRERLLLSTSYSFSAHKNEIIIENPSKTPVMISGSE